jgi:hypothetical protein
VNALLLMTSTFMAGADAPAVAAPGAPAAAVVGCSGCTDSCDACAKKPGILDKIKGRLGSHKCKSACEPACAPAPKCAPAPAPKCEDSCGSRPNLLDKLKGKFGHKNKDCGCAPACDSCGTAPAPVPAPTLPPKPMDPKKVGSEGIVIPSPGSLVVPSIPVTPVKANSPY